MNPTEKIQNCNYKLKVLVVNSGKQQHIKEFSFSLSLSLSLYYTHTHTRTQRERERERDMAEFRSSLSMLYLLSVAVQRYMYYILFSSLDVNSLFYI